MSDPVLIAVVAAAPGIIAALFAGFAAMLAHGAHEGTKDLHVMLNSRLDQLIRKAIDEGRILERTERRTAEGKSNNGGDEDPGYPE